MEEELKAEVIHQGLGLRLSLENMRHDLKALMEDFAPSPAKVVRRRMPITSPLHRQSPRGVRTSSTGGAETPRTTAKVRRAREMVSVGGEKVRRRIHRRKLKSESESVSDDSGSKTVSFNDMDEDKENVARVMPMLGVKMVEHKQKRLSRGTSRKDRVYLPSSVLSPLGALNNDNICVQQSGENPAQSQWCSLCKTKDCSHLKKPPSVSLRRQTKSSVKNLVKGSERETQEQVCSMCKTSSCWHLNPRKASPPCPTLKRSPCDGAPSSPPSKKPSTSQLPNHKTVIDYEFNVNLSPGRHHHQHQAGRTPYVLPAAKLLRRKLEAQTTNVLGGVSLRGLDGTDLSFNTPNSPVMLSPAARNTLGNATNVDINDISCIKAKDSQMSKAASVVSLRNRASSSNLVSEALHSTLNYPLHSTLNYPLSSTVTGMDPIPRDLSMCAEEASDCSSSCLSFNVDDTHSVNTYFGSNTRRSIPGTPTTGCHVEGMMRQATTDGRRWEMSKGNSSGSLSYSGSDSSLCEDSSVLFEDRREGEGCESPLGLDMKQMRRQTGQKTLQEVKTPKGLTNSDLGGPDSEDMTLLPGYAPSDSMNATRDSVPDVDVTVMPVENMILGSLYAQEGGDAHVKKDRVCNTMAAKDLDKTVHTGCMGLFRNSKRKQTLKRRKTVQVVGKVNNDNSNLLGSNCHGNLFLTKQVRLVTHSKSNVKTVPSQSSGPPKVQLKRKCEQLPKSDQSERRETAKRSCKRSATLMCHTTPKRSLESERRLSEILRNTPGLPKYELDSQLNVIRSESSQVSLGKERRRELSQRMKQFNKTREHGGKAYTLTRL